MSLGYQIDPWHECILGQKRLSVDKLEIYWHTIICRIRWKFTFCVIFMGTNSANRNNLFWRMQSWNGISLWMACDMTTGIGLWRDRMTSSDHPGVELLFCSLEVVENCLGFRELWFLLYMTQSSDSIKQEWSSFSFSQKYPEFHLFVTGSWCQIDFQTLSPLEL